MQEVFSCGNLNADGICRSVCGQWVRVSKSLKPDGVTSLDQLGTQQFMKLLWDAADSNAGINRNHLLKPIESILETDLGKMNPSWMAEQLTRGSGYTIFAVRGKKLDVGEGEYRYEGHAMATRNEPGRFQFLDPNHACWQFANSLEFYSFLPQHLASHYPELFSDEVEILRFGP